MAHRHRRLAPRNGGLHAMNQVSESRGRWAGPRRGLLGTVATRAVVAGSLAVAQPAQAANISTLTALAGPATAGRSLTVTWAPDDEDDVDHYDVTADGPDVNTTPDGTGCTGASEVAVAAPKVCTITGLVAGTPYTVKVEAEDSSDVVLVTGTIAPGASTTPVLPAPGTPTAAATGVSGEIEVTTNGPAAGADIASFTA